MNFRLIVVVLLFINHLVAGRILHQQIYGASPLSTVAEEQISCDLDKEISSNLFSHLTNTILTKLSLSSSLRNRDISIDLDTILSPSITPVTSIAGIFLIISGLFLALVGTRNQKTQVFISTTYLAGLGIAVLVLYLAKPPIDSAIQGAYLVAVFVPALVIGSLASLFRYTLESVGSASGGFCLAMFIMTLRDGGLLTSVASKITFIVSLTAGIYAMSFNRYTRAYVLVASTSLTGASAIILGIDCFSLTGIKEFWVYIWALNSRLFSESQSTYAITRGMAVEMAGIALFTILGIISQMLLWKIVMRQKRHGDRATHLEEQLQDDVEPEHTRLIKEMQFYEKQKTDQHFSNNKIISHITVGAADEKKSTLLASITDELDPLIVEALITVRSEHIATYDSDDAITPPDSAEQVSLSTPGSTCATSSSTTLIGTNEPCDEPQPDLGNLSMTPQTKQAIQERGDTRCITAFYGNKFSLPLQQLRPSKTFMDIVAAKLRQLSQVTRSSVRTITEDITSPQSVPQLSHSVRGPQFDNLSVNEAQITRPLLEQESVEQFVSSLSGSSPAPAGLDKPETDVAKLQEHKPEDALIDETESITKSTDRPPTHHAPVLPTPRSSEIEKFESQTQTLLKIQGIDTVIPDQAAIQNVRNSALADTGLPLDSLSKTEPCSPAEQIQLPQDMLQQCGTECVEQSKPIAGTELQVSPSCVPINNKFPAVVGHTLPLKPSQPSLISVSSSEEIRAVCIGAQKLSRTYPITSSHVESSSTEKTFSLPATISRPSRPKLRSFGSWPRHKDTKHSLQRRLQSSLRNSRSCVLNSPINEDEVASFTFHPSTTSADIPRTASYPYHARKGLDTGKSFKYTFGQLPINNTYHQSFINDGLRKKQQPRPKSDETILSRQRQAYLEKFRLEGRAQDQKHSSQEVHPHNKKIEQSEIPQHTLYRASMLADWRRSNPMELSGPT